MRPRSANQSVQRDRLRYTDTMTENQPKEINLADAWELLTSDPDSVLVDVRTAAEWNFVGTPDLSSIDKSVHLVELNQFPGGRNPSFLDEVSSAAPDKDAPTLLICRSGARSAAAAAQMSEAGWTNAINVVAGFEGDLNAQSHRDGGWKSANPWTQG